MRRFRSGSKNVTDNNNNMSPTRIVLAFDVYGTLLSTDSIAKRLASYCAEDKAKIIATTWRKYQLEYTWRLNSMGA